MLSHLQCELGSRRRSPCRLCSVRHLSCCYSETRRSRPASSCRPDATSACSYGSRRSQRRSNVPSAAPSYRRPSLTSAARSDGPMSLRTNFDDSGLPDVITVPRHPSALFKLLQRGQDRGLGVREVAGELLEKPRHTDLPVLV